MQSDESEPSAQEDLYDECDHPTHHRLPMMLCGILMVFNFAMWFVLRGVPNEELWLAGCFFLPVLGAIAWTGWYCRTARCPECQTLLPRMSRPWGSRDNRYLCPKCGVIWVSRIVGP